MDGSKFLDSPTFTMRNTKDTKHTESSDGPSDVVRDRPVVAV
jgi:hypothetical protein